MNWEAIAAIGQMLGSVAVLVTLGFLSIQIRHARQETRRALSQNRAESTSNTWMQANTEWLVGNFSKAEAALEGRPHLFIQALMDRAGMTNAEAASVYLSQFAIWAHQAQLVHFVNELPSGERSEFDLNLRVIYGRAAVTSLWYTLSKASLNPEAVRYIDNLLAQPR